MSIIQPKDDKESNPNLEYLFIGVFDGHGGHEASKFAKEHLELNITSNRLFWSERDKDVLKAIREGKPIVIFLCVPVHTCILFMASKSVSIEMHIHAVTVVQRNVKETIML